MMHDLAVSPAVESAMRGLAMMTDLDRNNPELLAALIGRANGPDPKFWQWLRDDLAQQGAAENYIEDYVAGLRAVATNAWPQ